MSASGMSVREDTVGAMITQFPARSAVTRKPTLKQPGVPRHNLEDEIRVSCFLSPLWSNLSLSRSLLMIHSVVLCLYFFLPRSFYIYTHTFLSAYLSIYIPTIFTCFLLTSLVYMYVFGQKYCYSMLTFFWLLLRCNFANVLIYHAKKKLIET